VHCYRLRQWPIGYMIENRLNNYREQSNHPSIVLLLEWHEIPKTPTSAVVVS
jgi:hypothetical protein